MIVPSSMTQAEFCQYIKKGNPTHVKIMFFTPSVTLTDDDISAEGGIQFTEIVNSEEDLIFGGMALKEFVAYVINSDKIANINWQSIVTLKFGVEDDNGQTEYVTVGDFLIKNKEKETMSNIIKLYAIDRAGVKLDKIADDFANNWLTYPITMYDMFFEACHFVGLPGYSGSLINNIAYMSYDKNPFPKGVTIRQIIGWIAEANCCYGRTTQQRITIDWFEDKSYQYSGLTGDNYFKINISEETVPAIDSVMICNSNDENDNFIYPSGTNNVTYKIVDNPLLLALSTADRTTALTEIVSRLSAFGSYTPITLDMIGNPIVEPTDMFKILYDGSQVLAVVFNRTLQWNGGCFDCYESTGKSERSDMTTKQYNQYEESGKISQKKELQTPVTDPTASGYSIEFIDSISQDEQGVITPTKKYVNIYNDINQTSAGYVLDARQGKALKDIIDTDVVHLGALSKNMTIASGFTASTYTCRALARMAYVRINGLTTSTTKSGWTTVATLPSGVTPIERTWGYFACDGSASSGRTQVAEARIETTGEVQIYAPQAGEKYWGQVWFMTSV